MLVIAHPQMAKLAYNLVYEGSTIKQCDKCSILQSCFSGHLKFWTLLNQMLIRLFFRSAWYWIHVQIG